MTDTKIETRNDVFCRYARELGAPDGWQWYELKHGMPGDRDCPPDMVRMQGLVPTEWFKSGKRKGRVNWSKSDQSTRRVYFFKLDDMRAWQVSIGECPHCSGKGECLARWTKDEGAVMRTCDDCGGTGKYQKAGDE